MRISDWSSDVCSSDLTIIDRPNRSYSGINTTNAPDWGTLGIRYPVTNHGVLRPCALVGDLAVGDCHYVAGQRTNGLWPSEGRMGEASEGRYIGRAGGREGGVQSV